VQEPTTAGGGGRGGATVRHQQRVPEVHACCASAHDLRHLTRAAYISGTPPSCRLPSGLRSLHPAHVPTTEHPAVRSFVHGGIRCTKLKHDMKPRLGSHCAITQRPAGPTGPAGPGVMCAYPPSRKFNCRFRLLDASLARPQVLADSPAAPSRSAKLDCTRRYMAIRSIWIPRHRR